MAPDHNYDNYRNFRYGQPRSLTEELLQGIYEELQGLRADLAAQAAPAPQLADDEILLKEPAHGQSPNGQADSRDSEDRARARTHPPTDGAKRKRGRQ